MVSPQVDASFPALNPRAMPRAMLTDIAVRRVRSNKPLDRSLNRICALSIMFVG
jgi:hypothetical protein